jgi:hypothetical protein
MLAVSSIEGALRSRLASAYGRPDVSLDRRNMKPTGTKPAVQISDADRKHKILITDKCTMTLTTWLEKGETLRRVDRYTEVHHD